MAQPRRRRPKPPSRERTSGPPRDRPPRPPRDRPPPRRRTGTSDLGARVLVAIPAAALAIAILLFGPEVFALGVAILGLICLHELYGMLSSAHPNRLAGFIGLIALVLAALFGDQFQMLLVLFALIPFLFVLTVLMPQWRPVPTMATTLLGVVWIGLGIGHAILLFKLPDGAKVIAIILVGTFLADTAAYVGGRVYGRHPLAPTISPNKTVEGLAFGLVGAIVFTWAAGLWSDAVSGTDALLIGLGVGLAAPVGDLFESLIKRDAGTKDTGTLFGAHGGALDRLDAVLFTLPVGYYIWFALSGGG